MKYTNRHKRAMQQWHKVTIPPPVNFAELKRWCQQQDGKGRFACVNFIFSRSLPAAGIMGLEWCWYFEFSEDATWFVLNHG